MTATDRFIADLRALADKAENGCCESCIIAYRNTTAPDILRLLLDVVEKARIQKEEDAWESHHRLCSSLDALEAHLKERAK